MNCIIATCALIAQLAGSPATLMSDPVELLKSLEVELVNNTATRQTYSQPSDSLINISDAIAILKHIVDLEKLTGDSLIAADINGDGKVNISDAIDVLQHIVGLDFITGTVGDGTTLLGDVVYTPADPKDELSSWSEWSEVSRIGGETDTKVTTGNWTPSSAPSTQKTIDQLRIITTTITTADIIISQQRTRTVVVNGIADTTPPAGELVESRNITESTPLKVSSASETRIINNPLYNPDPTVGTYLEGVDLTLGHADILSGQSRVRSWLNSNGYSDISNEVVYSWLQVVGLKEAHSAGWTGIGLHIGIYDSGYHGYDVQTIAILTAPGASVHYNGKHLNSLFQGMDITSHSYGSSYEDIIQSGDYYGWVTLSSENKWKAHFDAVDAYNPNALHVLAGPNTGNCIDDGYSTSDTCDAAGVAFIYQGLNGSYIFVGAQDNSYGGYNSVYVGNNSKLQDSWLVANGDNVLYNGQGTSYAAPKVAGAAAIVMHKFTNIDASDTKAILLNTADDSFYGYSEYKHGQGALDLNAALSPVGELH